MHITIAVLPLFCKLADALRGVCSLRGWCVSHAFIWTAETGKYDPDKKSGVCLTCRLAGAPLVFPSMIYTAFRISSGLQEAERNVPSVLRRFHTQVPHTLEIFSFFLSFFFSNQVHAIRKIKVDSFIIKH